MGQQGGKWRELTGWSSIEGQWLRRKHFTPEVLAHIAERIRQAEQGHTGELVVAIEAVMPAHERNSRLRALEVFGRLGVWDTPLNTGVLLYITGEHKQWPRSLEVQGKHVEMGQGAYTGLATIVTSVECTGSATGSPSCPTGATTVSTTPVTNIDCCAADRAKCESGSKQPYLGNGIVHECLFIGCCLLADILAGAKLPGLDEGRAEHVGLAADRHQLAEVLAPVGEVVVDEDGRHATGLEPLA